MIELLLASALQLPQVNENVVRYLSRRSTVDSTEKTAAARVALRIDPKGKVRSCDLVDFGGNEKSAKQLCRAIVGTRFTAAKDTNNDPAHSLYVTDLSAFPSDDRWRAEQMKDNLEGALGKTDIALSMANMPDAFFWKSTQTLAVMIDKDGKMTHCQSEDFQDQPWVHIACRKANAMAFDPFHSQQGLPVPYIRNLTVRYERKE